MNIQTSVVVAALLALAACTTNPSSPAPFTSGDASAAAAPAAASPAATPGTLEPGAAPPAASEASARLAPSPPPSPASTECTSAQFVACETGEACATRKGKLVQPKPCFDRAADACAALECAHGCNIHPGTPHQILCAPNAASSSHMKRCGGFANWACPERMRCTGMDPNVDDAMGTCVPES